MLFLWISLWKVWRTPLYTFLQISMVFNVMSTRILSNYRFFSVTIFLPFDHTPQTKDTPVA